MHFQPVMCERSWDSGLDLHRDARRGELVLLYGQLLWRILVNYILLSLRWKPSSLLQGDDDEPEGLRICLWI